jgi:predicted enzyme related to lactoylglutathione lyase
MPRVIHFEIPTDDPERAAKFYRNVFGWEISKWDGPVEYWLVSTGDDDQPGINGGLMRRPSGERASAVNTIDVTSVDDFIVLIESAGGSVIVPKMPVPGVGWLAYCKDLDGNTFGIMQSDPAAAAPALK